MRLPDSPCASPLTLLVIILVMGTGSVWSSITPLAAQSPLDAPRTRLTPIPSPGGAPFPAAGGAPATAPPSLGGIQAPLGGSALGGATATLPPAGFSAGPRFDPYATPSTSPGLGNNFGTPGLGTPQVNSGLPLGSPPAGSLIGPSPTFPAAPGTGGGLFGGLFSRPASGTTFNAPAVPGTFPGGIDNPSVFGPPVTFDPGGPGVQTPGAFAAPGGSLFPNSIYPSSTPSTLYPGGLFQGGLLGGGFFGGGGERSGLLRGPRIRHAYVGSDDDVDNVITNDTDVSVVFAFPNFLYSTQPLYVVPSFSLHLFDGPNSSTGADLPGATYSGFLDLGYNTDPNRILSSEFGVRVGVFSDFDDVNSDSIRVLGKGLFNFRLTPTATLKAGVYYLDRLEWKVLPAGGLLWQPNPYTRFDLFFPQPKLARYWRTVGTKDVWWYIAGDYGGGSWTIKRENGDKERFDLNDLRAIVGLEWGFSDAIRAGRRTAFAEVGYVFDRELIYETNSQDDLDVDDGVMFRLGIGY